jgi:hypothetical protein
VAIACMMARVLSPGNGRWPVAASYRTQPSEKMSERQSSVSRRVCSGDIYETVPTNIPGVVTSTKPAVGPSGSTKRFDDTLAMPKSSTLTC